MLSDKGETHLGVRANGDIMNLKVLALPSSLRQRASFIALALMVATAAQAADKGKPADAASAQASSPAVAAVPGAPAAALGLAPGEIPSDLESAIRQAQKNRKDGDFAAASKILSQLVLFAPDDPRVLAEYGKTLAAEGRADDALAFLERAIQLQPAEWSVYSAQGVAYDQKGNFPAAMTSYSRALALKPGEPSVLNNAALSRMQAGDLAGAEKFLMQAAPGAAEFPRIGENLALVESLKTARAAAPAPIETAPAMPASAAVAATPSAPAKQTPVVTASALPAPVPTMPDGAPMPMPTISGPPKATASSPAPAPSAPVQAAQPRGPAPAQKTLAELQSDPTVRMAPVPKDDKASAVKPPQPKPAALPVPAVAQASPPAKMVASAAPKPAPEHNAAANSFYVQAGAYATQSRADQTAATLDSLGARVQPATIDGHAIFRVRIGPFLDIGQANAAVSHAQALGHTDLKIVSE